MTEATIRDQNLFNTLIGPQGKDGEVEGSQSNTTESSYIGLCNTSAVGSPRHEDSATAVNKSLSKDLTVSDSQSGEKNELESEEMKPVTPRILLSEEMVAPDDVLLVHKTYMWYKQGPVGMDTQLGQW
ncbi:hypothetical protein R1sor_022700 [Riccia sorocarpa]|uniref:Uncharacterized protein n=1 Tax=Riccia sorocarpa TaxID=122646 RepID=A0ABD3GRI9_9MARC